MSEYQAPQAAVPSGKPGKVQAISIMCLISGIMNILLGIGLVIGLLTTLVCWPIGIYPIVLGILEIIYAAKLLPEPPKPTAPAQYLAIMEICNVLLGGVISLAVGIVCLVFYNDPEVKAYFATLALQQPPY